MGLYIFLEVRSVQDEYQQLKVIFAKSYHLLHCSSMLKWDEAVMMPKGGGVARANALAALHGVMHETISNEQVGDLLQQVNPEVITNVWDRANVEWMKKRYLAVSQVPSELAIAKVKAELEGEQAWRTYRAANDWQGFLPYLDTIFSLNYEVAMCRRSDEATLYDVLLEDYSPGFTQQDIDRVFLPLAKILPEKIKQLSGQRLFGDNEFTLKVSQQDPQSLYKELMKMLGFDFHHGRVDRTFHPFCGGVPEDVRITTHFDDGDLQSSIFGVCHETGHGLYEQYLPKQWVSQPVGSALGMSMHESQSLLIEMDLCKSEAFLIYLSELLQSCGYSNFKNENNLIQICSQVKPGLIRIEADEVCYPMHVILRYEIEKRLFSGDITVKDLPDVWNHYMSDFFGLGTLGNDKDGVMQDVHWPAGCFGYFPSYTLGRLIASQLYSQFLSLHAGFYEKVRQGDVGDLIQWLKVNVHEVASSMGTQDLLKQVTGESLNSNYFVQHIENRYGR